MKLFVNRKDGIDHMPFIRFVEQFWFSLRTSNNARAVFWLAYNALWFVYNVSVLFLWNAYASWNSEGVQRVYNDFEYGVKATDMEMAVILAPFFLKPFVIFWAFAQKAQGFSWLFWVISLACSILYFAASLREEVAGALKNAHEAVSRRTTNDAPDQPSEQPNVHPSAGASGGTIGNFLRNRLRFALEDLFWRIFQEGIQKGGRAFRG